ncbi:MAG: ATP synthase F1 complex subunit epsilon [Candidatus Westeberhardia cardiocondylae]|nr:ATP synthase F1 complex subunit epsilon [Candidatus Westeberhardia cardiocondylae]
MHTYYLDVLNIRENFFSDYVKKIQVTGSEGDLEIFPHHISLLTSIRPGMVLLITKFNERKCIYLSGGILEVYCNVVTILANIAIRGEDIDENRAKKSKERAERNMKKFRVGCLEYIHASIKFSKALAKLRVIKILKKNFNSIL